MTEKIKKILKYTIVNTIIVLSCVASFFVGFYYRKMMTNGGEKTIERSEIKKSDVNLAIDQYNNLMVINKKSGNYIVYEDSIGKSIFQIYARTMVNPTSNLTE